MPAPSEPVGQTPTIRRSFTLPTKLNQPAQRGSGAPKLSENVIFYHPSAKIVHFAPRALVPIPSSSAPTDFDYPVDTIETLPWRSATERTVATAPLRLERVHGLTAFLKCGNVVHAILKNSQCWCVDGVSKFVLRIRPLTYYRIEIPHETDDDKALVGDLKTALPTILRYEVTPCPFKRAFTVELPGDAMAPRRKRAWRPKERNDSLFLASGSSQGSPSETRSEWLDSASTGEDTDGGATDDSALAPQRTNSTTSDAFLATDQSPSTPSSVDKIEFPSPPKNIKRSVTEIPQTFTSLLAKFDAAPVSEEGDSHTDATMDQEPADTVTQPEPVPIPEVKIEPPLDPVVGSQIDPAVAQQQSISAPETQSVAENVASLELITRAANSEGPDCAESESQALPVTVSESEPTGEPRILTAARDEPGLGSNSAEIPPVPTLEVSEVPSAEAKPDVAPAVVSDPTPLSVAPHGGSPEHETLEEPPVSSEPGNETVLQNPTEADAAPTHIPVSASKAESESEPAPAPESEIAPETDLDHDSSFSSTPDSFHSIDPASPSDSVSTHTPPAEMQNLVSSPEIHQAKQEDGISTTPGGISSNSMIQGYASKYDGPSSENTPSAAGAPTLQPQSPLTHPSPRHDPPKPSLAIPSAPKPSSLPTLRASPPTDFDHMSSEFRRRAKATRERDVSPMPPPSAIYQPIAGDGTSSFLSKALTLVLVPPVSLFIVLLHVAARIVISPALNSTLGESSQGPRSSAKEPVTEDDFSFPLEPSSSSEYEDAEINKKLDPWDLD